MSSETKPPKTNTGDIIDSPNNKLIIFEVNGRRIEARPGDSLAGALWSNGFVDFGQDPITGQTRTVYCGIGQCGQCLVTVDGIEDVRACRMNPREGARVEFPTEQPDRKEDHDQ